MQRFIFSLERVLSWRRNQMDVEKGLLQQLTSDLDKVALAQVKADLLRRKVEQGVRDSAVVEAVELWALSAYRARMLREEAELARRKQDCERKIAAQRDQLREAERRCRLLERLEQRRRSAWTQAMDREMDTVAGESYLAGWNRKAAGAAANRHI
ncbi:MAG: hypothetical protein U0Q18_13920 [Bryobacteraceae bacterium]